MSHSKLQQLMCNDAEVHKPLLPLDAIVSSQTLKTFLNDQFSNNNNYVQ